jgi:hypothetical protein
MNLARRQTPGYEPAPRQPPKTARGQMRAQIKKRLFGTNNKGLYGEMWKRRPTDIELQKVEDWLNSRGMGIHDIEGGKWYDDLAHVAATALPFVL